MKKFVKKEKGITLIALIITIIVMLILVGVTINVALNGGLFDKAKTAADKTQREADREELLSAILGTANNRGDLQIVSELGNNLPDGWNPPVQSENNEYLQCTSIKNNVFYVNKETGEILDKLPDEENNILVGKSFYIMFYEAGSWYEFKSLEVVSNTKVLMYIPGQNEPIEENYTFENNLLMGQIPVYIINKNDVSNIVIILPEEDNPGYYTVHTSNKGANVTPLAGKIFKENDEFSTTRTIEFLNNNGYGIANDSGNDTPTTYSLIDTGNICKLYIGNNEFNVTKTNGEYTSFSNYNSSYELYTPEP